MLTDVKDHRVLVKSKNIFRHTVLGGNSYPKAQAHLAHTVQVLVAFGPLGVFLLLFIHSQQDTAEEVQRHQEEPNLSGQEMSDQSDDDEDSSSSHSYLPPEG